MNLKQLIKKKIGPIGWGKRPENRFEIDKFKKALGPSSEERESRRELRSKGSTTKVKGNRKTT